MAKVTGLTADRMLAIEAASVVDGEVVSGHLILEKHDGTQIDAGSVLGPPGPQGPQGTSAIPGEVKLWPIDVLPELATYGKWVWADGAAYPVASHPIAASHIGAQWRTFGGAADPGAGNFRVPDLRGLVPAGLDQMPGGTAGRANRMTRAEAIIVAKISGEEKHRLVIGEHARHSHGGNVGVSGGISGSTDTRGGHQHSAQSGLGLVVTNQSRNIRTDGSSGYNIITAAELTNVAGDHAHTFSGSFSGSGAIAAEGSDTPHENVQPTVFVPYIICLDT